MKTNKYYCSRCSATITLEQDVEQYPTFCEKTQKAALMIKVPTPINQQESAIIENIIISKEHPETMDSAKEEINPTRYFMVTGHVNTIAPGEKAGYFCITQEDAAFPNKKELKQEVADFVGVRPNQVEILNVYEFQNQEDYLSFIND